MKRTTTMLALATALILISTPAAGQAEAVDRGPGRHSIGSSLFVLANLVPMENHPSFFQLNYGYRPTDRDVISLEAITWQFQWPLGIPLGPSFDDEEERYPGSVREYGLGVAYQRFLWKDAYSALHALPLVQQYRDEQGDHIQNGFKLFLTARVGYQVRFFRDRFFIEPSVAVTHWPIDTNVPAGFAEKDSRWPKYHVEPGLHFGVRF